MAATRAEAQPRYFYQHYSGATAEGGRGGLPSVLAVRTHRPARPNPRCIPHRANWLRRRSAHDAARATRIYAMPVIRRRPASQASLSRPAVARLPLQNLEDEKTRERT
eukprot:361858-Chlamydomonas_euryale.AAC.2